MITATDNDEPTTVDGSEYATVQTCVPDTSVAKEPMETIEEGECTEGVVEDDVTSTREAAEGGVESAAVRPVTPQVNEPPKEEPMPTEEECVARHLGERLLDMYMKQTPESRVAHSAEFPVRSMAVDVELAQRAMRTHETNLRMMQSIAQQFSSKEEKKSWEATYSDFLKQYSAVEEEYSTKRAELNSTVRAFVHKGQDKAQQIRLQRLKDRKPLSKGRRKHFWDALSADDVPKLKKTLQTADDVKCACYSVRHADAPSADDNPTLALLSAFVSVHRSMPSDGAHRTLGWLLTEFHSYFGRAELEQAKQHIIDSGWQRTRVRCLAVLDEALQERSACPTA